MSGVWSEVRRDPRTVAVVVDLAIHALAFLLVLDEIAARSGPEATLVATLLFPITYLAGPLTLGVAADTWLPFTLQLGATIGAVGLLGLPTLDRDQADSRSCLQLLASTLLVVLVDLVLHVGAVALVIGRLQQEWGFEAALVGTLLFPLTWLLGPLSLAFVAGDWLPLLLQLAGLGLIGLLVAISEA